jgi:phage baseplate assembly protein W
MAYQIINSNIVNVPTAGRDRVLGISLNFNGPGIFEPIYLSDTQAVENLKNLLLTTPGERIENITFGCDLMNVIFEPNTENIKGNISEIISGAVSFWLPYIDLTGLDIKSIIDDPTLENVVEISISFQVTGTINEQTLSIQLTENGVVNIG